MAPLGLGHSLVPGSQVLQPNIHGGANPSGAHYPNPMFSSRVEAVGGCGGKNPGYNVVVKPSMGGGGGGDYNSSSSHRRGGQKKHRRSNIRKHSSKRRHHSSKRHCKCRGRCHCKRQQHRKRSMRAGGGGLSALSPSSFSSGGENTSYGQYGNQAYFGVGGVKTALAPNLSGMAAPPPITDIHKCS